MHKSRNGVTVKKSCRRAKGSTTREIHGVEWLIDWLIEWVSVEVQNGVDWWTIARHHTAVDTGLTSRQSTDLPLHQLHRLPLIEDRGQADRVTILANPNPDQP